MGPSRSLASASLNKCQAANRHRLVQKLPLPRRASLYLKTRKVFPQTRHCRKTWPTSGAFSRILQLYANPNSLQATFAPNQALARPDHSNGAALHRRDDHPFLVFKPFILRPKRKSTAAKGGTLVPQLPSLWRILEGSRALARPLR